MGEELAARQLLGSLLAAADDEPPLEVSDASWPIVLEVARHQRVVPLLGAAIREGRVAVDDVRAADVEQAWLETMEVAVRLEARLIWLADRCAERGIEIRSLKGPASAHLDHPRPEARQFGDIDVLVQPADLATVGEVLAADGFVRRYPEPRPGFDRRFTKSVCFVGDIEFDVHRTLAEAPLGNRIPLDDLWRDRDAFVLGATEIPALDAEARLLHACVHAELAPPPARLSSLSDVAAIVARGAAEPGSARERGRRWGVEAAIDGALDSLLRVTELSTVRHDGWIAEGSPSILDAVLLAAHRDPRSSWALRAVLGSITLPSWPDRLAYWRALAVPDRRYVDDRYASRRQRWRHLSRLVGRELGARGSR